MGSEGIFNHTISLLEKSLDLRAMKHHTIASNVANIDTPNYKAFDVMVEEALQKYEKPNGAGHGVQLETTQHGHIRHATRSENRSKIRTVEGQTSHLERADGNTVDLDREMALMAENSMIYNISAQIIAKKFQSLRNIIQGGKK